MDWFQLERGQCVHDSESLDSKKGGKFLDQLSTLLHGLI
jgi:hypothetical protein